MDPIIFDKQWKKININKKDWQWPDKGITYFLPEILTIKESWNLIVSKANKQTNKQTVLSFHAKKHYDHLILFPDIDYQRILEPDWVKDTTGHTQPKEVILHATFPWWLPQCKKSKRSTDSF